VKLANFVNASHKRIVACDIPSGLSPDEGLPLGAAIKADYTVTFIAPKQGFFLNQGKKFCGRIMVADIGISRDILEKVTIAK
jgi:NAD(P)H-hydrate epimerase